LASKLVLLQDPQTMIAQRSFCKPINDLSVTYLQTHSGPDVKSKMSWWTRMTNHLSSRARL